MKDKKIQLRILITILLLVLLLPLFHVLISSKGITQTDTDSKGNMITIMNAITLYQDKYHKIPDNLNILVQKGFLKKQNLMSFREKIFTFTKNETKPFIYYKNSIPAPSANYDQIIILVDPYYNRRGFKKRYFLCLEKNKKSKIVVTGPWNKKEKYIKEQLKSQGENPPPLLEKKW